MTIGLGVGAQRLCAVGVVSNRIEWALQMRREPGGSLAYELEEMLRRATIPRWPCASVAAAIGPFASQTKLLCDLPLLEQDDAVGSVVREGVSRFFLRNGVSLLTSNVLVTVPGSAWATAYDEPVVADIRKACGVLRLRLNMVAPTVLALTRATPAELLEWRDGDVAVRVECTSGALRHVSRSVASRDLAASSQPVEALARLGADAWLFADAYGVTQLCRDEPLALSLDSQYGASARSRGIRIAAAVTVVSFSAAAIAPSISSYLAKQSAEKHLRRVATPARDVLTNEREVGRITSALAEVATFNRSRHSVIILLGSISRALPDKSVILTLNIDSLGGTAVLLANRAGDALRAFDNVTGVHASEISGPVTKELSAGRELERATVRFRFIDATGAQ